MIKEGDEAVMSDVIPNEIATFIHCKICLDEFYAAPIKGLSPREYSKVEVGFTNPGVQVWCKRHEVNVMHIDFEGAGPFQAEVGI